MQIGKWIIQQEWFGMSKIIHMFVLPSAEPHLVHFYHYLLINMNM